MLSVRTYELSYRLSLPNSQPALNADLTFSLLWAHAFAIVRTQSRRRWVLKLYLSIQTLENDKISATILATVSGIFLERAYDPTPSLVIAAAAISSIQKAYHQYPNQMLHASTDEELNAALILGAWIASYTNHKTGVYSRMCFWHAAHYSKRQCLADGDARWWNTSPQLPQLRTDHRKFCKLQWIVVKAEAERDIIDWLIRSLMVVREYEWWEANWLCLPRAWCKAWGGTVYTRCGGMLDEVWFRTNIVKAGMTVLRCCWDLRLLWKACRRPYFTALPHFPQLEGIKMINCHSVKTETSLCQKSCTRTSTLLPMFKF